MKEMMKAELSTSCWGSIDENPFLALLFRGQWPGVSGAVVFVDGAWTKIGGFGHLSDEVSLANP